MVSAAARVAIKIEPLAPLELQCWLNWAGAKLLALQLSSPLPKGPHSSWPEYAQDYKQAYGYTGEKLKAPIPRAKEIELMDQILLLPALISEVDLRRIVNARSLTTPVSNRHLYSWTKLSFMLRTNPRLVARSYARGLLEIIYKLSPEKVDTIRHSFITLST